MLKKNYSVTLVKDVKEDFIDRGGGSHDRCRGPPQWGVVRREVEQLRI